MIDCGYFDYLLGMISSPKVDNHRILLNILFGTDFRWTIPNDDNRESDGLEIRYNFGQEFELPNDIFDDLMVTPCSVMEVIIGLAIRMDDYMRDPEEPHINRWFWEMIYNLGLDNFTDEDFKRGLWNVKDASNILDIFMDRTYDELGHGGLFPRNVCYKNQKVTELYAQMNGYLSEFYC